MATDKTGVTSHSVVASHKRTAANNSRRLVATNLIVGFLFLRQALPPLHVSNSPRLNKPSVFLVDQKRPSGLYFNWASWLNPPFLQQPAKKQATNSSCPTQF
ncbi:hypothetical protein L1887_01739 [Cichorium endivia]|nr:hypothetical protein L1887_01739 [Cichorium endivia]